MGVNPTAAEVGGTLPSISAPLSYAKILNPSNPMNPWKDFSPDFRVGVKDGIPSISFAPQDLIRAESMVTNALVIKFSAGRPSVDEIRSHIVLHWGVSKVLSIGLIDSRHILLRLASASDVTIALAREKKHIKGFWFRLFQWSSSFDPKKESALAPVWVTFPKLPIHLFNPKMLEGIASLVGRFIKTDSPTMNLSRPSVARVCVELDLTKPTKHEIWINKGRVEGFVQPVEYEYLPKYCGRCFLQGHALDECKKLNKNIVGVGQSKLAAVVEEGKLNDDATVGISSPKEDGEDYKDQVLRICCNPNVVGKEGRTVCIIENTKQGDINVPNAGKVFVNIPKYVGVSSSIDICSSDGLQEEPIVLADKEVPNLVSHLNLKESNENVDMNVIVRKKKKRCNKSKETLVGKEVQEVTKINVDKAAPTVKEAASTTSTDPSIPPGFESYNKFHELEEEEEVATSNLGVEELEISIHKPSSSEPILASNRKVSTSQSSVPEVSCSKPSSSEPFLGSSRKVSSKAKASGLFPKGSLDSNPSGASKCLDGSNKISATGLIDSLSVMGMVFPSSKNERQEMFNHLAENHKELDIVGN